jgi:gluconokinase
MGAPRVVVMGVSGCGKSTVGQGLARVLGLRYVEGDELHPARNVERMRAGIALTDEDRQGWLQAIAAELSSPASAARGVVVSCSALKRSYRDLLRAAAPDLRFVHLHGDPALLAQRMAQRQGHYMPASLLQSQLQTLEMPAPDERAVSLDIAWPASTQIEEASRQLRTS